MALNTRAERDCAMRKAYGFARQSNYTWCQIWIDRANDFLAVTPRQLAYAQKFLNQSRKDR